MISPELRDLLAPLERFEEIRAGAVRLGSRVCDLSYANPYGGVQQRARTAIRETLQDERTLDLQYAPAGGQVLSRRAVADSLRRSHDLPFSFQDVVLASGAAVALHLSLRSVGAPGDEIVIPTPCWLDYPLYARFVGLEPVLVPLSDDFDLSVEVLNEALSDKTRAVLFSHPANPTGVNYSAGRIAELAACIARAEARFGHEITLIADETHRDFVRPDAYTSAARHWPRTLLVYSFGKYHFMQGQRLGYVSVSPDHPRKEEVGEELVRWCRILGFAGPTSLMQRAVPRLLKLHHEQDWLESWRGRFVEGLTAAGYSVIKPDATMFVYVRTPTPEGDFEFISRLARQGVLALPAPVFHHHGYFRLSLTGSEPMLERALSLLVDSAGSRN